MLVPTLTEEGLIELEVLRDEKIDTLVNQGFLCKTEQWNHELRNAFVFTYPEIILEITKGERYPVEPLDYHLKNICLPRVVIDDLRVVLRQIYLHNCQINTVERCNERGTANSIGIFAFEMAVLHVVAKTIAHLLEYRRDPTNSRYKTGTVQQQMVDRSLVKKGLEMLEDMYGIDLSRDTKYLQYQRNKQDGMDGREKLDISSAKTKKDIIDSEFGLNPSSIGEHDLVISLLGKTPDQICLILPEIFRIFDIECVVRSDLSRAYLEKQTQLRKKMMGHSLDHLRRNVSIETYRELKIEVARRRRTFLQTTLLIRV